jgi:hypothetical protein
MSILIDNHSQQVQSLQQTYLALEMRSMALVRLSQRIVGKKYQVIVSLEDTMVQTLLILSTQDLDQLLL